MKKTRKIIIGCIFVAIILTTIPTLSATQVNNSTTINNRNGKTIYVDDDNTEGPWDGTEDHPFQYIQDGIANAVSGDTVYVFSGIYLSQPITNLVSISKSIDLIGENPETTTIRGGGYYGAKYVVAFGSEGVGASISGFTIEYSGTDIHDGGIHVHANNIVISNNIIRNNEIGIYFPLTFSFSEVTITNNIIENNDIGIFLWESSDNIISENIIRDNTFDGIKILQHSDNNIIQRNTISGHTFQGVSEGIIIKNSQGNTIIENNFQDNIKDAYFENAFFNTWDKNFWNTARFLPKAIPGELQIGGAPFEPGITIPLIKLDRHPAKQPYEIQTTINPNSIFNS